MSGRRRDQGDAPGIWLVGSSGYGSKHDIHRHANAEEWEYVISGRGIKHIGDEQVI